MAMAKHYSFSRSPLRPGDDQSLRVGHWRVVVFEPGPSHAAPRRGRIVHTLGYVFREGCFGWTADPTFRNGPGFGGYPSREWAADALFDDWRADNIRVAMLVGGRVVPPVLSS